MQTQDEVTGYVIGSFTRAGPGNKQEEVPGLNVGHHRRTGAGLRRDGAVAKRTLALRERPTLVFVGLNFHLRLQRDRPAGKGHPLFGGRAGLHPAHLPRWRPSDI